MKFACLLLLVTLNLHAVASSGSCEEARVNTQSMPKNTDQGPLYWCAAFTSADLLSFYEERPFSAYDLAITYLSKREDIPKIYKSNYAALSGFPDDTISLNLASAKGLCLEKDVFYEDPNTLSQMFHNLSSTGLSLNQTICENKFKEKEFFRGLTADVIKILEKLPKDEQLLAILDIKCNRQKLSHKYDVHKINLRSSADKKKEDLIVQIDEKLGKNEPIIVGYSKELLIYGRNYKGTPNHVSTIIGRKFNTITNECEYLIKNSFGKDLCNKLSSSFECEDGNSWVPRSELMNNSDYVSWVDKK